MNSEQNPTELVESKKQVPIKRILPDDLPMLFSDGLMVQEKDGMFILYFLQSRYPLAITPTEIENIEYIKSYCVAQIILTPQQMERNIKAMAKNFEKFFKTLQENTDVEESI